MDRKIEYIDEVIVHKIYVLEAVRIFCAQLIQNQDMDRAIELIHRCSIHDASKFSKDEMDALIMIQDQSDLKDPTILHTEEKARAISLHWKKNSHHPEYHNDIHQMSELDLMEMACDCYARSLQFGTDFLSFIKTRQENRFHFPPEIFEKYYGYCLVLNNGLKKNEKK